MENIKFYDVAIIGAGGVGLSAAMYAARLGLKTLVLGTRHGSELSIGGVITTTDVVENYPGFIKLTGREIAKKIEDHARSYKLVTIKEEKATGVKKQKSYFIVKTEKSEYKSKSLIFATGTKLRELPETVKGSEKFKKKGINYCALCDGPLYKNKIVSIVGGSDSAAKDALVLARHAKKVYIIYRGKQIHPEPVNFEKIKANKKIEIINNTDIIGIKGDKFVEEIVLDKPYKGSKTIKLSAVFVAIGHIPLSELAKKLGVKTNKANEIKINHIDSSTNIKGVFAAGDVTDKPFKQLITGVAEGCTASYSAYKYINKNIV
ncbi:MAG TPA: FAD-dependent oxidoreductase [Candidatus Nanoarchaeia archaeon]|nr:FAD-dependent oxidoreductase [Candidatus Nanoarchaeia archaeon]